MGAHAGIFFFDGRPTREERRPLIDGFRAVDSAAPLAYDGAGIAVVQSANTPWIDGRSSSALHPSPGGFVVAWDGRLDNRDDLAARLGGSVADAASDAEVASAIVDRWGLEALGSLIGDWSLAAWDIHRRSLHLARDFMGARPLYYALSDRAVAWSSSLGELVERTGRTDALSVPFVAAFMTLGLAGELTPYEGVRAVPPAWCVSFSPTGTETRRRFWRLEPDVVRFARSTRYEEQLRTLWRESVSARLRTRGTIWCELSGGLDSSSVACMAHALIAAGRVPAESLRLISHATLQSPEGDERRFIAEVEARTGISSEIVGVEQHHDQTDHEWGWVTPYALHGVGLECVRRIRYAGGRVVLSGRAGDAVMGCQFDNSIAVLDDFADWRPLTALRKTREWSRVCRKPLLEIAGQLARARRQRDLVTEPRGTSPAGDLLAREVLDAFPADSDAVSLSEIRPAKRDLARMILRYSLGARLDVPSHPPGVVYTYPFLHRPLVEFMMAIPGEQLSAPGRTRALMRRAFEGLVPARILRRVSKGYYPPAALRAVRPLAAMLLPVDRLEVVQRGWIEPRRLDDAIRQLTDGGGESGADVYRVLRLEQWLLSRHRRAPAVIPQREEVRTNAVLNA